MRKNLVSGRHWDRSFITVLGKDLSESGFSKITVKLPIYLDTLQTNKEHVGSQINRENRKLEIPFQDFLNQERNYSAIILVALNPTTQETIKVLFLIYY